MVADCAKKHVPASFPGSIGLVKDPEDSNRVVINPLYRQYGDTTNKEFNYFLSRIVQAINPTKTMYSQRKHKERIGEIFSVTDEAFGLLIIYNEHHVWKSQDEAKRRDPGTKETVRKRKKFCDSTSGSRQGWMTAGLDLMNDLCIEISKLRKEQETGEDLEISIRDKFADELGYTCNESGLDNGDSMHEKVVYQNFDLEKLFEGKALVQEEV